MTKNITAPENTKLRPWLGASWKFAAFVCYAGLNAISRLLSGGVQSDLNPLPVCTIVFFQDFFALLFLLPWILTKVKQLPQTKLIKWHGLRGVTAGLGVVCWYFTLNFIPMGEAVALRILGPIIALMGAKWFLKEKFGKFRITALGLSLLGSFLITQPQTAFLANQNNWKGLIFVALTCTCFSLADLTSRHLAKSGESVNGLTGYLLFFIVPIVFLPTLFNWVTPFGVHWLWLMLAGGLTALSIYCISSAFVFAELSFLALFSFCQFFLNTILGYLAFKETPATWTIWLVLAGVGFTLSNYKRFKKPQSSTA